MIALTIRVSEQAKAALEDRAKASGQSVSEVVRGAIEALSAGRGWKSAHDKAKHLCGSMRLSPGASTSKDYLRTFGT